MSLLFPPRPEDFKFAEAKSPRLRIVTYSDTICTIIVRGITKTGLIHASYLTDDACEIETNIISLTEIPLTISVETSTPVIPRGRLYCQIYLEFSGVPASLLAADYITFASPLSWPDGQIRSSTDGPGYIHTLGGSIPVAGSELSHTVPTNTLWLVSAIFLDLITSATAATRTVRLLLYENDTSPGSIFVPTTTQTASLTRHYRFSHYNNIPDAYAENIFGELTPLKLITGGSITTLIHNLQAADQIDYIYFNIEQWLNP